MLVKAKKKISCLIQIFCFKIIAITELGITKSMFVQYLPKNKIQYLPKNICIVINSWLAHVYVKMIMTQRMYVVINADVNECHQNKQGSMARLQNTLLSPSLSNNQSNYKN
jgi:hypothetical protein